VGALGHRRRRGAWPGESVAGEELWGIERDGWGGKQGNMLLPRRETRRMVRCLASLSSA
jgi:hypothetical protein